MPHSKQAQKRLRQSQQRRVANKARASAMKTEMKKTQAAIDAGNLEQARAELCEAMSKIDKAAKRNVIHANTAARKKSLLARRIRALETGK